jgi:hypothetical protein
MFDLEIKQKFKDFDKLLFSQKSNSFIYDSLLSIRTHYCVYITKSQLGYSDAIKGIVRLVPKFISIPFVRPDINNPNKVLVLGNSKQDQQLSSELHCGLVMTQRYNKKINFPLFLKVALDFFRVCKFLVRSNLNKKDALLCWNSLFDFLVYYNSSLFNKTNKVLITENDIDPINVAVILKAKEMGIKTIKIEYSFIDGINHNNVLCDYYFYPSTFHRNVRKAFLINKKLNYVEGGFPHLDAIKKLKYRPQKDPKIITYFTAHGGIVDDIFYIKEILSVIEDGYVLYVKVHPREDLNKYNIFINSKKCKIVKYNEVDNYTLIKKSHICISVMSFMCIEAKHICDKTFFINYNIKKGQHSLIPYDDFSPYIEVISSRDYLKRAIAKDSFRSKEFHSFFNFTYPNTVKSLKILSNKLML